MTANKHYNTAPVVGFLGHGAICNISPPHIVELREAELYSIISKNDAKNGHVLQLDEHIKTLQVLLDFAQICAEDITADEVVAKYCNLVHTGAHHTQHISSKFQPANLRHPALARDHVIYLKGKAYDVRLFEDRVSLMSEENRALLKKEDIDKIREVQMEQMVFLSAITSEHIQQCYEIRDRMVNTPCGLLYTKKDNQMFNNYIYNEQARPPLDQYLLLKCKLNNLKDHGSHPSKEVAIEVLLNKSALWHDMLKLNDSTNFIQYKNFLYLDSTINDKVPYACASASLSGKHFIFTHLKCKKEQCASNPPKVSTGADSYIPPMCNDSKFCISDILNNFISKLHVLIEYNPQVTGPRAIPEADVTLYISEQLGTSSPSHNESFMFYDLKMPPNSTMILSACSGHDTIVEEIFQIGHQIQAKSMLEGFATKQASKTILSMGQEFSPACSSGVSRSDAHSAMDHVGQESGLHSMEL